MIKLREAVIVEGKYDKIKLRSLIDAPIIETNGFRVFKDKEKQTLIRKAAASRGILIITDSDSAGFVIRNFLKGIVPADSVKHCYIPQLAGKEKRKAAPSKEGLLGVEGMSEEVLLDALKKCGVTPLGEQLPEKASEITKQDLFDAGLSGCANSSYLRRALCEKTGLPSYLTANALIAALNCIYTKEEFFNIIEEL